MPATTCASRTNGVLAFRVRGFKSWGDYPGYLYFGGNSELRGYDYLQFLGNKAFFANAELRFPLIEAALTPIGVVGGLRGVVFANLGASQATTAAPTDGLRRATRSTVTPLLGYTFDPTSPAAVTPVYRPTRAPSPGFRLVGRPRLVRHRPRDLRARLPDPLRLVVADAASTRTGKTTCIRTRARATARAAASGSARPSSASGSATTSKKDALPSAGFPLPAGFGELASSGLSWKRVAGS